MLTQVGNRASTQDIDVVLKDVVDTTTSILYREFKSAIRAVARKNNIPETWLNDIISDFLLDIGNVPEGTLWKRYDALEVYLPSKDYILALKLLAGRPKDRDDIISLSQLLQIRPAKRHNGYLTDTFLRNRYSR